MTEENNETETEKENTENNETETTETEIEYSLKLKEGSDISDNDLKLVEKFAKDNSLSNESAQKMLDSRNEVLKNFKAGQSAQHDKQLEAWEKEVKEDKELGGENLESTSINAKTAIDKFAPEGFAELLKETGYASNPLVVRFINKIGQSLKDSEFIKSNDHTPNERTAEEIMYGKQ